MRHLFSLFLMIFMLFTTACSILQKAPPERQTITEWDVSGLTLAQVEAMRVHREECVQFAFKARVAGSTHSEYDIGKTCMERKGYKLVTYVVYAEDYE